VIHTNPILRSGSGAISGVPGLMVAVALTIFYSIQNQVTWAVIIICPVGATACNGTGSADVIVGTTDDAVIHGLGGNDWMVDGRISTQFGNPRAVISDG
jgi:hypothetical protein